jgi:hypothetical protein
MERPKERKLELPLEKKEQEKAAYLPFPVTEDSSDMPMPHANASTPTKKIFIPVLFAACSFLFFEETFVPPVRACVD